jgi:hypothetical protein
MKVENFSILHPWAYDLDTVDFKYVVNKEFAEDILKSLPSANAQVFWVTYFKSELACSADSFFHNLREVLGMGLQN